MGLLSSEGFSIWVVFVCNVSVICVMMIRCVHRRCVWIRFMMINMGFVCLLMKIIDDDHRFWVCA